MNDEFHIEFMQDVRGALGKIEANQDNTLKYLENVATKLNRHVDDPNAHERRGRNETWVVLGKLIAGVAAIAAIATAVAQAVSR